MAASERFLFYDRTQAGQSITQSALCFTCHDGSSASNTKTGMLSFAAASGHALEERGPDAVDADLTDSCASCHYPHNDWTRVPRLPQASINGAPVDGPDNSWCFACHDDAQSWYASATETPYPQLSAPVRGGDGYPETGTFPGPSVYLNPGVNAHALIPASVLPGVAQPSREATRVTGDCLYCHAAHRGVSERDGLVETFGPSTLESVASDRHEGGYAAVCFRCHASPADAEIVFATAADIKSLALAEDDDPSALNGHRIRTAGGDLPVGAPLPCYECHNPHGSTRGNARMIADTLGGNLDPSTDEGMRRFCFTCHSSYDTDPGTGRPYGWDSEANGGAGGYVPVPVGSKVAGLSRTASATAKENKVRLWRANGHDHDDTQDCLQCHGNVHRPMGGVSLGGENCLICHSALEGMIDDTSTYHHVLDDPDPGRAPGTTLDPPVGEYPVSKSDLACVSCHVDHDMYMELDGNGQVQDPSKAPGKAYSLRSSATDKNSVATNTDAGLCLSCHTEDIERNTTGQKPNAIQETKVWHIVESWWNESPHNYESPGPFNDGSIFRANCAKCHGTLEGTLSSGKFAVHFSAEQRLLNALGDPVAATLAINEEQMCFRCHSRASDFAVNGGTLPGIPKPSDFVDWYGTEAMSRSNTAVYGQMTAGVNTHGHKPHLYQGIHLLSEVDETQAYISANKHVECADCHNHHVVGNARHEFGSTNEVSDAIRGVTGQAFNSAAIGTVNYPTNAQVNARLSWKTYSDYEYEICFKCHSSANTNYDKSWWGGTKTSVSDVGNAKPYGWPTYVGPATPVVTPRWTNVAADFSLGNQSRHPVIAPLPVTDPSTSYGSSRVFPGQLWDIWSPGDTMYCSDCHGDSSAPLVSDPNNINHAQGPHGSSVAFSLRGPRTDWPVATTGPQAGQLITMNMLTNTSYDNLFCSNCHPGVRANKVHGGGGGRHASAACVNCHTLIPHGGGMSRLIADGDGAMPARFAYNNDKRTAYVASFNKRSDPNNYVRADCTITTIARTAAICGTQHTGGSNPAMENW